MRTRNETRGLFRARPTLEALEQRETPAVADLAVTKTDGLAEMTGIVEKPKPEEAPSTLAWIGRSVVLPEVFDHLDKHETGAGGEIQLTDAIARLLVEERVVAYQFDGRRYDCGSKLGYLEATVDFGLKHPETADAFAHFLSSRWGSAFVDPA